MRRLLILSFSVFFAAFTIYGCAQKGEMTQTTSRATSNALSVSSASPSDAPMLSASPFPTPIPKAVPKPQIVSKPDFGPLSNDLYSFQLQIDDEVYQFPMSYAEFSAFGWSLAHDGEEILEANINGYVIDASRNALNCYAQAANFDIRGRLVTECHIVGIDIREESLLQSPESSVLIPGGMALGRATLNEVKEKFGNPSYEHRMGTETLIIAYILDDDRMVSLNFSQATQILQGIRISNELPPEGFVPSPVSTDLPEIVKRYQPPDQLGETFESWTVEFDGTVYTLPIPVQALINAGWKVNREKSEEMLKGREQGWLTIENESRQIRVIAQNYSEDAAMIEHCFAVELYADNSGSMASLTIPKGITVGMHRLEMERILANTQTEQVEQKDRTTYQLRPYAESLFGYDITVSHDTEKISKIVVFYQPSVDVFRETVLPSS